MRDDGAQLPRVRNQVRMDCTYIFSSQYIGKARHTKLGQTSTEHDVLESNMV